MVADADVEGNITFFVAFLDASDGTTNLLTEYSAPATATLGSLADDIATAEGLATGSVSLMQHRTFGLLPQIEARATVLSSSVIPNGARVLLVPGS